MAEQCCKLGDLAWGCPCPTSCPYTLKCHLNSYSSSQELGLSSFRLISSLPCHPILSFLRSSSSPSSDPPHLFPGPSFSSPL